MEKVKEEILERLRNIKQTAQDDLEANNFENYEIKNVTHYNENVKLINKKTGKVEEFDLYVVITENPKPKKGEDPIFEIEYLENKKGEIFTIADLIQVYEGFENIKDVIDKAKENEERPEEEQDEELKKDNLDELEDEKEQEENEEQNKIEKNEQEENENDLTGKKPKNVIQTIDIDKAYAEEWKTVRRAFGLPSEVEKIAIAEPIKNDQNALSPDLTIYMLDSNGNIIEDVEGKKIKDFFELDMAMGKNAMSNESTQMGLDGEEAKRTDGQIMRSFRSTADPDLYLAASKKKVGEYVEVSAGRKSMDGNDFVGVQLETHNVELQTDLQKQKLVSGYRGTYNSDEIDKEVDKHVEIHGDDKEKIALENADGDENTVVICESPYIPGTEMTWEELSEETGEGITKLQERFEREVVKNGLDPKEAVEVIENDYGMVDRTRDKI